MEEAYAEAYHPRSNRVVKICIPNNYEVTDFLDLPKLEITFVRLKGGLRSYVGRFFMISTEVTDIFFLFIVVLLPLKYRETIVGLPDRFDSVRLR